MPRLIIFLVTHLLFVFDLSVSWFVLFNPHTAVLGGRLFPYQGVLALGAPYPSDLPLSS